ncbi:hypothetical protein B0H10DRAFT_2445969 [Mycena sp. CBHHK59/15]|nr:hypothetical protein B0H10DRAFT_2445969 [Mycena sp. CBHHK59/15]
MCAPVKAPCTDAELEPLRRVCTGTDTLHVVGVLTPTLLPCSRAHGRRWMRRVELLIDEAAPHAHENARTAHVTRSIRLCPAPPCAQRRPRALATQLRLPTTKLVFPVTRSLSPRALAAHPQDTPSGPHMLVDEAAPHSSFTRLGQWESKEKEEGGTVRTSQRTPPVVNFIAQLTSSQRSSTLRPRQTPSSPRPCPQSTPPSPCRQRPSRPQSRQPAPPSRRVAAPFPSLIPPADLRDERPPDRDRPRTPLLTADPAASDPRADLPRQAPHHPRPPPPLANPPAPAPRPRPTPARRTCRLHPRSQRAVAAHAHGPHPGPKAARRLWRIPPSRGGARARAPACQRSERRSKLTAQRSAGTLAVADSPRPDSDGAHSPADAVSAGRRHSPRTPSPSSRVPPTQVPARAWAVPRRTVPASARVSCKPDAPRAARPRRGPRAPSPAPRRLRARRAHTARAGPAVAVQPHRSGPRAMRLDDAGGGRNQTRDAWATRLCVDSQDAQFVSTSGAAGKRGAGSVIFVVDSEAGEMTTTIFSTAEEQRSRIFRPRLLKVTESALPPALRCLRHLRTRPPILARQAYWMAAPSST